MTTQRQAPLSVRQAVQQSPPKLTNIPRIEVVRVYPMYPRRVFVQWVIRNPGTSPAFVYQVYRSGSTEGEWEHIGVDLDTYYFVDEDFPTPASQEAPGLFSTQLTLYYKITAVRTGDPTVYEVIKKMEPWLDARRMGMHRKFVRDALVALKKVIGTEVTILKRLRWGERCSCVASTGQSTRASCPLCFGTTFVGGYWEPVYGYAQLGSQPVSVTTAIQGKTERREVTILMSNVPQVGEGDLLIFLRSDRRFEVKHVTPTQVQNVDVHQEVIASELSPYSVEYNIPVNPWLEPCWWVI